MIVKRRCESRWSKLVGAPTYDPHSRVFAERGVDIGMRQGRDFDDVGSGRRTADGLAYQVYRHPSHRQTVIKDEEECLASDR